jgi:phosphatidylglycerophosphate synthase
MIAPGWLPPPDGSRDRRIEDPTNLYFVHLTGRALLPLALRARIAANAVSLCGLAFGISGALAFYRWSDWRYACLGFTLCSLWLIADGLDGMIARATGTTSAFGRFLDGVCDHVVFVFLYCSLAASLGTVSAWVLAFAAGAVHALQATLYEGERTRFHRRLKGEYAAPQLAPSPNLLVKAYDRLAGSLDR